MKKTALCAVLLCGLMAATGCNNGDNITPPDFTGDISLKGTVESGGISADLELKRTNDMWIATFSPPESVKGMTVTLDSKGKYGVTYDGLTFDYSMDDVPFISAMQHITKSIEAASDPSQVTATQESEGTKIAGATMGSGFVITSDKDGDLTSVSIGGYTFKADNEDMNTAANVTESSTNSADMTLSTPESTSAPQTSAEEK